MSSICRNIIPMASKGLAFSTNLTTFMGLFGLDILKRDAVSGLERCLLSRGILCRISRWSTGIPSRLRNDWIPGKKGKRGREREHKTQHDLADCGDFRLDYSEIQCHVISHQTHTCTVLVHGVFSTLTTCTCIGNVIHMIVLI